MLLLLLIDFGVFLFVAAAGSLVASAWSRMTKAWSRRDVTANSGAAASS